MKRKLTRPQAVEGAKETVAHSLHRVGEALHLNEAPTPTLKDGPVESK